MSAKLSYLIRSIKMYGVHAVFFVAIALCVVWIYSGMQKEAATTTSLTPSTVTQGQTDELRVRSRDDAVRGYMKAALVLAEVYKFNNNGSYDGLCERSEDFYTLEGESGGILKYVKMVGATEVFCHTGGTNYMIEVKLPESGKFFCIDASKGSVEQAESREEHLVCKN